MKDENKKTVTLPKRSSLKGERITFFKAWRMRMKWLGVGKGQTSVLSEAIWDGESIIDCDGGL